MIISIYIDFICFYFPFVSIHWLMGGYMLGIIRKKKPAFIMSGLLSVLYIYIFILIQLETFALLAGSLGLFVILAAVMYFSKKIDWFNE